MQRVCAHAIRPRPVITIFSSRETLTLYKNTCSSSSSSRRTHQSIHDQREQTACSEYERSQSFFLSWGRPSRPHARATVPAISSIKDRPTSYDKANTPFHLPQNYIPFILCRTHILKESPRHPPHLPPTPRQKQRIILVYKSSGSFEILLKRQKTSYGQRNTN